MSRSDRLFLAGVVIYAISALAFLSELIGEITGYYLFSGSWIVHELIAIATLIGFIAGAGLLWFSHRRMRKRHVEIKHQLRAVQGEFHNMLQAQFDIWELSAAERDVALMTVKGLSVAEIAGLRDTSQGTVKSQNNAIYRKAGVKSRTQLIGSLIEELLVDTAPSARPHSRGQKP